MKQWFTRLFKHFKRDEQSNDSFTREQLEKAQRLGYDIGYNDGKRDGLAIAREQATKSLKEILWQQNKPNQ